MSDLVHCGRSNFPLNYTTMQYISVMLCCLFALITFAHILCMLPTFLVFYAVCVIVVAVIIQEVTLWAK